VCYSVTIGKSQVTTNFYVYSPPGDECTRLTYGEDTLGNLSKVSYSFAIAILRATQLTPYNQYTKNSCLLYLAIRYQHSLQGDFDALIVIVRGDLSSQH
jgi:hypothetical protein